MPRMPAELCRYYAATMPAENPLTRGASDAFAVEGATGLMMMAPSLAVATCPAPNEFLLLRLAARVMQHTLIIPALVLVCALNWYAYIRVISHWQFGLSYIGALAFSLSYIGLTGALPGLRHAIAVDGVLHHLGAGRLPIGTDDNGRGVRRLRCWAVFLSLVAAIVFIYILWRLFPSGNGSLFDVTEGIICGCLVPLTLAWYLTLKLAAALGAGAVARVRAAVSRCDPSSPEWHEEVHAPTQVLVTTTFPALSRCLAGGAAAVAWCCWVNAISQFAWALGSLSVKSALYDTALPCFLLSLLCVSIPMLVLYDLADASSDCDQLIADLNHKRVTHPSDEAHMKIQKLEVMLDRLNKKQGLGFVVGGIVLDKATFSSWMIKLSGLAVTGVGSLLALQEPKEDTVGTCELSESVRRALQFHMQLHLHHVTHT
jgi:hypothetical protein